MKNLILLFVAVLLSGCASQSKPVEMVTPTGDLIRDGITFVGCTDTVDGSFHAGSFQDGGRQLMINNGKPIDGEQQNQFGLYSQGSASVGYYSLVQKSKIRGAYPPNMKVEMLLNGKLNVKMGDVASYKCELIL